MKGVCEFSWHPRPGETVTERVVYRPSDGETRQQALHELVQRIHESGYTPPRWWQWWRWGERRLSATRYEATHVEPKNCECRTCAPASEPRDDAEAMCRLLASIWFYGNWRWETPNERELQAILERRGWWPITEDALIAKARAADQTEARRDV